MAPGALPLAYQAAQPRSGAAPHPLLVLLHGRGANELDLLPLAGELDGRFLVISVRAPHERWGGYHWYDLQEVGLPEAATYAAGLARLRQFLDETVRAFPVDPARVYVLGFSQGAMMSGSVLLTEPERLAGAVLLSGYLPPPEVLPPKLDGLRGKPVFVGHGTADNVLPIGFGRAARATLEAAGADLTYQEYPMAHQISGRELEDVRRWLTAQLDGADKRSSSEEKGAPRG